MSEYLFIGTEDQVLKQWSVQEKKVVKEWDEIDPNTTYIIAISPDGKYIFKGSKLNDLVQYSMEDGSLIKNWGPISNSFINCIKVTQDNQSVITASMDEDLCQFSLTSNDASTAPIAKLTGENIFDMSLIIHQGIEY